MNTFSSQAGGSGGAQRKLTQYFGVRKYQRTEPSVEKPSPSTSKPDPPIAASKNNLLKPVSELPARFRHIFPYVHFNHVQSLVFDTVMTTNKPIVVSAPTGSGKTGIFELAIVKLIIDVERRIIDWGAAKIIYLAPTKALCAERVHDWKNKFRQFDIECKELTSDVAVPTNFKDTRKSSILVATPEKWDSITRSWVGHKSFVQSIRLLLVDEIHLVNDGMRGATLEAVVSRMKTIRSLVWPTDQDNLRFVAASATVSNVHDIAEWFSSPTSKAEVYQVHPRERPVKLRTIVLGYSSSKGMNDFSFDFLLNHRLPEVIQDYSSEKPTLIFCATRKSTSSAATTLVKEAKFDYLFAADRRKQYLNLSAAIRDKTLQETTRFGVAFHHAGLCASDRKLVETSFLEGRLMILCCTSTLAMGVNLPAHLVIIKGTMFYDEGQFKPYTESSLVQMIGRAGRPQFDSDATAVIMTKSELKDGIQKMLTGKLVVESQLHKFLTEHVNSEIVLGTVNTEAIARKWFDSTFLHVRFMKSPENYGLTKKATVVVKEGTIVKWCTESIQALLKYNMVRRTKDYQLESTDAGRAMAKHYVCLNTAVKLVQLLGTESLQDLIRIIASSQEVANDTQIRAEDRHILSVLSNPKDDDFKLRFPIKDEINTREKKAAALIQATLGNITFTENGVLQESIRIMKNATRVMNCLKEMCLVNGGIGYRLLRNVLILSQCFVAQIWENSMYVSKQLEKIGPILSKHLAENGLTTFESLRRANPANIEIFCNRLPPFGSTVQQTCFGLPIYKLKVYFRQIPLSEVKVQLIVEVMMINGQDIRNKSSVPKGHECILIVGNIKGNKLLLRHRVIDIVMLNKPDMTVCYGTEIERIDLPEEGDEIEAELISEMFVGLNAREVVKYSLPGNADVDPLS